DVVAGILESDTAGRARDSQVGEQWDLVDRPRDRRCAPKNGVQGIAAKRSYRRGPNAACSTHRARGFAPAEAQLRTDVAGKLPGGRHHAGFDFHFLRLAVQL